MCIMAVKKSAVVYTKKNSDINKASGDPTFPNYIPNSNEKKLDQLVQQSGRVIIDIKSVFPFVFFPDELVIDETKVSVHTNYFFYTKEVRSIEYKDIFNVVINQGILFARIEIVDRYFSQQTIIVDFLKKREAILARRIIQGLIISKKENIDTRSISTHDLIVKLSRIGKTR